MGRPLLDVHAHYLPPAYREAAIAAGHSQPDGVAALPEWEAAAHVALMDRLGIGVSILSTRRLVPTSVTTTRLGHWPGGSTMMGAGPGTPTAGGSACWPRCHCPT